MLFIAYVSSQKPRPLLCDWLGTPRLLTQKKTNMLKYFFLPPPLLIVFIFMLYLLYYRK